MKIGIDIRVLDEPDLRGMGKYLFFLLRYLTQIDQKNNYFLFSDKRSTYVRALDLPKNFRRVSIGIQGEKFHLWEQVALPLSARKLSVDILHYPANLASLFKGIPSIVTLHDVMMFEYKSKQRFENFYTNFIFRKAIKKAEIVITVSEYSKKKIIEYLDIPPEKIQVIYHGIDPVFRKILDRDVIDESLKKYNIKEGYIFCVGGNTTRKNVSRLISAYLELRKNNFITYKLLITGALKSREELFKGIPSAYLNDIIFLPYITNEELASFYNAATLTVYPSCNEGFGFPVLEAMACGSPIVTSNRTSLPEVGGNGACYMNPFSIEDISRKILEVLMNNSLRESFIKNGFERVKQFKWESTARETLDVYEMLYKT